MRLQLVENSSNHHSSHSCKSDSWNGSSPKGIKLLLSFRLEIRIQVLLVSLSQDSSPGCRFSFLQVDLHSSGNVVKGLRNKGCQNSSKQTTRRRIKHVWIFWIFVELLNNFSDIWTQMHHTWNEEDFTENHRGKSSPESKESFGINFLQSLLEGLFGVTVSTHKVICQSKEGRSSDCWRYYSCKRSNLLLDSFINRKLNSTCARENKRKAGNAFKKMRKCL